jgi:hypothetical protein
MSFIRGTIAIFKSVPKPVWIAVVVPGGFLYLGALAAREIYRKINKSNKIDP